MLVKEWVEHKQKVKAPPNTLRSQPPYSLKMVQAQTWVVLCGPHPSKGSRG